MAAAENFFYVNENSLNFSYKRGMPRLGKFKSIFIWTYFEKIKTAFKLVCVIAAIYMVDKIDLYIFITVSVKPNIEYQYNKKCIK